MTVLTRGRPAENRARQLFWRLSQQGGGNVRTDAGVFKAATSCYRRELFAHCYRMTGSVQDAEDLTQETFVRAWSAFERFERRSSVRTLVYRIATNVCLTELQRRSRRPLPSGLGLPSGVRWLEPVPDRLVLDEAGDPADVVTARESVRCFP
jgi:RNA polymerase sigma-70 factor (ECF subfamily)